MSEPEVLTKKIAATDHAEQCSQEEDPTLRSSVKKAMRNYFNHLDGQQATNIYQMVISEVEAPLLETVMEHVNANQTLAAAMLGLNRGTLRKKLKHYGII